MKKFILLTLIFICMIMITQAQTKHEIAVAHVTESLRKAMVDADKTMLEYLVSDNLSYGHSSGQIDTKKIFVEKLVSGQSDFVSIDLNDQSISINKKTAIVRHKLDARTNDGGKPGEVHLWVLLVWQKQGGKWKLLARQAVKAT